MNKLELFFQKIIELRWYVLFLFGLIGVCGYWSLKHVEIDAIPDITNKQVVVNTKTGSMDPIHIEKSITYLIESKLYGVPGLIQMRSLSRFGLSQITLIFHDSVDIYFARNLILERISSLANELPQGVNPSIAPLTTGVGEILTYRVYDPKDNNTDYKTLSRLRAIQEYTLSREIKKVKGIVEVDTAGGFVRELHLNINSGNLLQYGMTLDKLIKQVLGIGEIAGGGYIEKDGKQMIVRTNPGISDYKDIMKIPIKIDYRGKPVLLEEVVEIQQDYSQRLGLATHNGEEAVIGTVMLQSGENAKEVLKNVKAKIQELNSKNSDIQIEILYDREFLINSTIKTVMKNLIEGILLVIGVLCLLIGNIKAGIIVASCLPFCIFILAIFMKFFGISANLMSLGAIDFGLIVDASVVVIECIIANLYAHNTQKNKEQAIAKLVAGVAKPITFGITILTLVYTPILLFSGIEGKTFKPMAINVVIALISSIFVTFLLMPVLSYFFIKDTDHKPNKLVQTISKGYETFLEAAFGKSRIIIIGCLAFFITSMALLARMSSDFLPELNEGDIVYTVVTPENTSLSYTAQITKAIEKEILKHPAIKSVHARTGTSEAALDPMPQNATDMIAILKEPYKKQALEISAEIYKRITAQYTECEIINSQPIKIRFNEMLEGSRADIALRIFGEDLKTLMNISETIVSMLKENTNVKEAEGDFVYSIRKGPIIDVLPNYPQIAKHQITIADINNDVANSMAGINVGNLYFPEFPIPVVIHIGEHIRNDLDTIRNIRVGLPDGGSFPISKVSDVNVEEGIISIPRLFGKRYSSISIYLNNTDYANFVQSIKKQIKEHKVLPEGYYTEWGGRFNNLVSAKKQIFTAVPIILTLIIFLLYKMFGSIKKVAIVFSSVPFGISGGVVLLFICNIPITISVHIGFIALIGISLLNSIILLDTANKTHDITVACLARLRPILMTALVASFGFIPMAFGHGIGAEVQQPIAITVIGGIVSSTIATLLLTPILLKKYLF